MKSAILVSGLLLASIASAPLQGVSAVQVPDQVEVEIPYVQPRPVFFKTFDFYNPGEHLSTDAYVYAENLLTGDVIYQERLDDQYFYEALKVDPVLGPIMADSDGFLLLAPGIYRFGGEGRFCFVAEKEVEIKTGTHQIDLEVGCE